MQRMPAANGISLGRLLLAALPAALLGTGALAQSGAETFALTADQRAIVRQITQSTDNSLTFTLPDGSVKEYRLQPTGPIGAEVRIPFRDGKYLTLIRRGAAAMRNGGVSWRGEVWDTGERAALMLWNNALLSGYFAYNGTIYTLENVGGGIHAAAEMDPLKVPLDHPPGSTRDNAPIARPQGDKALTSPPEPAVEPFSDVRRQALEANDFTIDVMLLYTRTVPRQYIREPDDLLALAIEEANETFSNSGIGNVRMRLVHSQLLDYDGSVGDQFNHLYRMVDGEGPFKDVKRLRNEKRADIVGLIIDNANGCGLSTRIGPESDDAFFVVHHTCALLTNSIAHEIGHILGTRHDRFVDQNDAPVAYAHGYVNGTKWRTMMSYKEGCGGCPRIPYWSNPRVAYMGEPTGTPASDNARLILEMAERVAKFR